MGAVLATALLAAGCASPEQKLRDAAAQAGREAASEVGTARLAVEQLQAGQLWAQPAGQVVGDAEKGVEQAASSFAAQQPTSDEAQRLYDQVTKALDDATQAVTSVRIALGNGDLDRAGRQLAGLRVAADQLRRIGEL
ncbi:hypothetical protein HPO96_08620 [Kribbella sandramycini]|uniref:Outer membrane murein-binding lipoprotein Lpp n=1 Tax=Kribbella sandramycini TaxID=60450 RepID=A0A7Y4KX60_9ACTN|nr:hypothetical protein [Kribbella sandramycini]MBB6569870.1 outer membrane murein-binding lipoprotein Lpp [Kribbella sandramycini]NOL40305.1 hypothetical protein [Kribbella sandramycini]